MIISYSRNFAFVRVPKAGSTTAAIALATRGLLDETVDYCSDAIDLPYPVCSKFNKPKALQILERYDRTHHRIADYKSLGVLPDNMPVYATIRNPVERFVSMSFFLFPELDPNLVWDDIQCNRIPQPVAVQNLRNRLLQPQSYWIDNNTILWNTEQLDYHITQFLLTYDIDVKIIERFRTNLDKPSPSCLTRHRRNQILDHYSEDMRLWSQTLS